MENKYYSNPFRDDDDEACYAEIDMVEEAVHGQHDAETMPSMSREQTAERPSTTLIEETDKGGLPRMPEQDAKYAIDLQNSAPPIIPETKDEARDKLGIEYEQMLADLRRQVEQLTTANSNLCKAQTKLQAQVRSLTLEKDNLEWMARRQKEHEEALTQQVKELEEELNSTRDRTQAMIKNMESSYHGAKLNNEAKQRDDVVGQTKPDEEQHDEKRPAPQAPQEQATYVLPNNEVQSKRDVSYTSQSRPESKSGSITLHSARQKMGAVMTDEERETLRERERAIVEQLEAQLLAHSQRRDDLTNQLQRLESVRLRNAADKNRKVQVENELASEQKVLGSIRLQLRAHASLTR